MNIVSESILLDQLRGGSSHAAAQLYGRYHNRLLRFCVRLLRDEQNAEDVVQNVFEKLQTECRAIRSNVALQSWLFTVARNDCLGELRKTKTEPIDEDIIWDGELPDEALIIKERKERVECVLQSLHAPYREVIMLREYENMAYEEIAVITDTTVSSVKSRLFHARKALIAKLGPYLQ
ncbi:MAG: sigma-70 family RNA polymerase sigma factor [Ignavibacteriales bacterium]|nr:sigma-70 family RNA polymerase sigma factor [Ignavibacteriales bacterium]